MVSSLDIDKAKLSNYSGQDDYSIDTEVIDSAGDQKETVWDYPDW